MEVKDPLVITGIGGSGTRVFPRILRRAGLYMGTNLNREDDALDFFEFVNRWIGPYLAAKDGRVVRNGDQMRQEFLECVRRFRSAMEDPAQPWGWKQPRSIHFVSFLRELYPGMKLLHVVRDGRDVAFGSPIHLALAGEAALGRNTTREPTQLRMMRLWHRANTVAADFGEGEMGDDYLRVRFEDLCAQPEETIRSILRFSGEPGGAAEPTPGMLAEVIPPPSIGRWGGQDRELVREVTKIGASSLRRFGYLDG